MTPPFGSMQRKPGSPTDAPTCLGAVGRRGGGQGVAAHVDRLEYLGEVADKSSRSYPGRGKYVAAYG